jgi:hypothetical protein
MNKKTFVALLLTMFLQGIVAGVVLCMLFPRACHAADWASAQTKNGVTVTLTDEPAINTGFMWWYAKDKAGHVLAHGQWTAGKEGSVLITDGKGNMWAVPTNKFH